MIYYYEEIFLGTVLNEGRENLRPHKLLKQPEECLENRNASHERYVCRKAAGCWAA